MVYNIQFFLINLVKNNSEQLNFRFSMEFISFAINLVTFAVAHVGQTLWYLLTLLHHVEVRVGLLKGKKCSVVALFHYDESAVKIAGK